MADGIDIDMTEMHKLVADLSKAGPATVEKVDPIIKSGAAGVEADLNAQAAGSKHFKGMAGSVTSDRAFAFGLVNYEIGPDKSRRGGALGNIFFFGGANGGGGTGDLDGALEREEPKVSKALGDLLGGIL